MLDNVQKKADEFVVSLIEAGETAWLGWLLYVLERLDKEGNHSGNRNRNT